MVVRSCRPRRKRGIIIIIVVVVVVVVVMCVDVPSASSGDFFLSGGVKDNVFLKYRYGYGQLQLVLENDPPNKQKKEEKRKMSKKIRKIYQCIWPFKSYNISLSPSIESERKKRRRSTL